MNKVLIVDDDLKFQRLLMVSLQKYSNEFEIILANNGEEAISVLEQKTVSLVVTDIQMPKVDGLALLAYINLMKIKAPCIIMSAHATPAIEKRLSKNNLRLLSKPFKIDTLAQAIIDALKPERPMGSLKGISIASFLQMIEMEEATCILEVVSAEEEKGLFYLENGELYDAMYLDSNGDTAALAMLGLEGATIGFGDFSGKKMARNINTSLMGLIMDAARIKDESDSALLLE